MRDARRSILLSMLSLALVPGCAGLLVVASPPTGGPPRRYSCDAEDGRALEVTQSGEPEDDDPARVCAESLHARCRCAPFVPQS